MTQRGKVVGAGAALLLVLVIALGGREVGVMSKTESFERSSHYFRLKASYSQPGRPSTSRLPTPDRWLAALGKIRSIWRRR